MRGSPQTPTCMSRARWKAWLNELLSVAWKTRQAARGRLKRAELMACKANSTAHVSLGMQDAPCHQAWRGAPPQVTSAAHVWNQRLAQHSDTRLQPAVRSPRRSSGASGGISAVGTTNQAAKEARPLRCSPHGQRQGSGVHARSKEHLLSRKSPISSRKNHTVVKGPERGWSL